MSGLNDWASVAGQVVKIGAPTIGAVLGGPAGGVLGDLVGNLLGQALGVPATPEAIGAAINSDPAAAAKVQAVEASAGAHLSLLEAQVQDKANARSQTVELVKTGSGIAWGAPVVSAIVTTGFCAITAWAVVHGVSNDGVTQTLVGVFATGFANVVGYWLGSSFGSQQKDATIAAAIRAK